MRHPHLIEWTFAGQLFRFELTAEQDGCALVFTTSSLFSLTLTL